MSRRWVLAVAVGGCVVTIFVAIYRNAAVLAGLSAVATLVTVAVSLVKRVRNWLDSERIPFTVAALVAAGAVTAPLAVALLPARVLGGGTASSAQPESVPPSTPAAAPSAPVATGDPQLDKYCDLAVEFLGHAQRFSGKGWQGAIKRRDFDPIVRTVNAALETAPQEMRAALTILASSYEAAQANWSDDDIIHNIGVALGTILSPSARAAADTVDDYENEHCF
jgi:hypothetical protein